MKPLAMQMPLVFQNGARWNCFSGWCDACGEEIETERILGGASRPFDSVYVVDAEGHCVCGHVTKYHYRLHDDLSMTGRSPVTGEWARWARGSKKTWWQRAFAWARGLL